jgi:hypothetical protein
MEPRLETELVLTTESREQLMCRPAIMGPPTRPAEASPAPSHAIPTTAIKAICRWTEQDDLTLIAVLRAEQQLNPTPTGGFKGSAWPAAAAALAGSEERTGSKTKDPIGCRSRYSSVGVPLHSLFISHAHRLLPLTSSSFDILHTESSSEVIWSSKICAAWRKRAGTRKCNE